MNDKAWHDCPCGLSICVPDSAFGRIMLDQWRTQHAAHQSTDPESALGERGEA